MESLYYDFNKLLDELRSDNLYVLFSNRGCGKNVITKIIKAVNLIEQIYKTKICVYRDDENNGNIILCGLVCDVEIKLSIQKEMYDLSTNYFAQYVTHQFTDEIKYKLLLKRE